MAGFILSPKAKSDINNIYKYTSEKWSISQADKYFNGLQDAMNEISLNPDIGRKYGYIKPDYFGRKYKSHIIFYQILNSNEIKIIRILQEKMDIPNILNE